MCPSTFEGAVIALNSPPPPSRVEAWAKAPPMQDSGLTPLLSSARRSRVLPKILSTQTTSDARVRHLGLWGLPLFRSGGDGGEPC